MCTDAVQPISNGLYARRGMVPRIPIWRLFGEVRRWSAVPRLPDTLDGGAVRGGRAGERGRTRAPGCRSSTSSTAGSSASAHAADPRLPAPGRPDRLPRSRPQRRAAVGYGYGVRRRTLGPGRGPSTPSSIPALIGTADPGHARPRGGRALGPGHCRAGDARAARRWPADRRLPRDDRRVPPPTTRSTATSRSSLRHPVGSGPARIPPGCRSPHRASASPRRGLTDRARGWSRHSARHPERQPHRQSGPRVDPSVTERTLDRRPEPDAVPARSPDRSAAPEAGPTSAVVVLHDVTMRYPNGKVALKDVDLVVPEGDFVFLVGPSGAGKSTLTKLLIRDELATKGMVVVDGDDLARLAAPQGPEGPPQDRDRVPGLQAPAAQAGPGERRVRARGHRDAAPHYPACGRSRARARRPLGQADQLPPSSPAASSSAPPSPGRSSTTRGSSSPTSPPATSIRFISWEIIQLLLRINELGVTSSWRPTTRMSSRRSVSGSSRSKTGRVMRDEIGGAYHREH